MKSNSFNEGIPDGEGRTEKATGISDKVNGIGSRLKQTIFGISKQ
jgi:hypothetical protein